MLDTFISWLIPFLCGGAVTFAGTMLIKLKAIKNGLQCLLRAEIIRSYDKYTERGYCPLYAKEALTRAYKAYHALIYRDMTEEEIAELYSDEQPVQQSKDNLTALAEGLSTANNMKDVQKAAKNILESERK